MACSAAGGGGGKGKCLIRSVGVIPQNINMWDNVTSPEGRSLPENKCGERTKTTRCLCRERTVCVPPFFFHLPDVRGI